MGTQIPSVTGATIDKSPQIRQKVKDNYCLRTLDFRMWAPGGYRRCPTSPRARHRPCDAGGFEIEWIKEVFGGSFGPVNCGDRTRLTAPYLETQATAMTDGRD